MEFNRKLFFWSIEGLLSRLQEDFHYHLTFLFESFLLHMFS